MVTSHLLLPCMAPHLLLPLWLHTMSLLPACCSLGGCFSLLFFLGTSSPPYCCYSMPVALLLATPCLLVAPPLVTPYLLVAPPLVAPYLLVAYHLCFLGWYSFHLIFFLQVVFGAIVTKQRVTAQCELFLLIELDFLQPSIVFGLRITLHYYWECMAAIS